MKINLRYEATFNPWYSTGWVEWPFELTVGEESAYCFAIRAFLPLHDMPDTVAILERAYREIEAYEIQKAVRYEVDLALRCTGQYPVEPARLNDLVHSRNEHALAFYGLQNASDTEINAWDANKLNSLPDVCDFEQDFEPSSPFDQGWTLRVAFADPEAVEIIECLTNPLVYRLKLRHRSDQRR